MPLSLRLPPVVRTSMLKYLVLAASLALPAFAHAQQQHYGGIASITPTTLAFADPAYVPDGNFSIVVTDNFDCTGPTAGVYTVAAAPVAGSGPSGSTPAVTTTSVYSGVGAGTFLFVNAGTGRYAVTVTETGAGCSPPVASFSVDVFVPQSSASFTTRTRARPPTLPFGDAAFTNDGELDVSVVDGTCTGAYTVAVTPVIGSGPGGSTPPDPLGDYAGAPAATFVFLFTGLGQYRVDVSDTSACVMPSKATSLLVTVPGSIAPVATAGSATPVPADDRLALLLAALALTGLAARRLARR